MREFILWARRGRSTPVPSVVDLSRLGRITNIAQCIVNTLFFSNRIRPRTVMHIVLDGPAAPPKIVRIESNTFGSLRGFDDRSICSMIQNALDAGRRLALNEEVQADAGVYVAKRSFESLIREKSVAVSLFCLHRGGEDIRSVSFSSSAAFVFTDHLTMPKRTARFLVHRLRARRISVGPKILFASQCIAIVHNELDRQGIP